MPRLTLLKSIFESEFEEFDLDSLVQGFEDLGINQKPQIYVGEIRYFSHEEGDHSCFLLAIPSIPNVETDIFPVVFKAASFILGYDEDFREFQKNHKSYIDKLKRKFQGQKDFTWHQLCDILEDEGEFEVNAEWVIDWPTSKKFNPNCYVYTSLIGVNGAVDTDEELKSNFGFGLADLNKMPKRKV